MLGAVERLDSTGRVQSCQVVGRGVLDSWGGRPASRRSRRSAACWSLRVGLQRREVPLEDVDNHEIDQGRRLRITSFSDGVVTLVEQCETAPSVLTGSRVDRCRRLSPS